MVVQSQGLYSDGSTDDFCNVCGRPIRRTVFGSMCSCGLGTDRPRCKNCLTSIAIPGTKWCVPCSAKSRSFLELANLPKRHADTRSLRPIGEKHSKIMAKLMSAEKIGTAVITGPRGTGKTQLAVEWIRYGVSEMCQPGLYLTNAELEGAFQDKWARPGSDSKTTMTMAQTYPRVAIDAIRPPKGEPDDAAVAILADRRYRDGLDTLLICNIEPDRLADVLGDDIVDRVSETGLVWVANWKSFREAK